MGSVPQPQGLTGILKSAWSPAQPCLHACSDWATLQSSGEACKEIAFLPPSTLLLSSTNSLKVWLLLELSVPKPSLDSFCCLRTAQPPEPGAGGVDLPSFSCGDQRSRPADPGPPTAVSVFHFLRFSSCLSRLLTTCLSIFRIYQGHELFRTVHRGKVFPLAI